MKLFFPVILIIAGALYYFYYYPPMVLKGKTEAALQTFATSVQLKDRDAVAAALNEILADDAQIELDVKFFAFGNNTNRSVGQKFSKSEFILFIDNVLYPLTDYGYTPQLDSFTLSEDETHAGVAFSSQQWAEGASLMGGMRLAMRYNSRADCSGQVVFAEDEAKLQQAYCSVTLEPIPTESPAELMKKLSN